VSRRSVSHRAGLVNVGGPSARVVMSLASGPKSCGPVSWKSVLLPACYHPSGAPGSALRPLARPGESARYRARESDIAPRRSPVGTACVWSVEPSRDVTDSGEVGPVLRTGGRSASIQASTACVDDAGVASVLVVPLSRGQGRPQAAGELGLDAGGGGGPEFSDNGSGPAARAGPHSPNRRSIRRPPRVSTTAGHRRGGR
jgi:hypothetical protein